MKIAFHTLGCKVNHYETESIKAAFTARGAVCVGEEDPADVYIINTCTVTNIADRKSRQYIRRVKRINPDALIVVTGCYAQVEPDEIASMPEVDIVIGNGLKSRICDVVTAKLASAGAAAGSDRMADPSAGADGADASAQETTVMVLPRRELNQYENMEQALPDDSDMTRAYIKIQEGCDRFCAYCLIPFARGPVRSRPPEDIVREAVMLLDSGRRELVLTGINTALYGTEAGFTWSVTDEEGMVLPGLERYAEMSEEEKADVSPIEMILARLDALEGDFRIRLSSLEPTVVDRDHVEKIIRCGKLCRHLHLSVQSGSSRILKAMNRHYTREEYLDIVGAIREFDPLYGITTDIIVGFPGETDEDFEETLDVVRKAGFGKVHVFRYSPRRGTIGESLPDAVPGKVKNTRSDILEAAAAETARSFMLANCGKIHTVLTEEDRDGYMTGYTSNYIKVYIPDPQGSIQPGELIDVRLTGLYGEGCTGEIL